MRKVLGITNELSQALQRKEQDITNAVSLVTIVKFHLQDLRDNGWDSLLHEVQSFCSTSTCTRSYVRIFKIRDNNNVMSYDSLLSSDNN
jgi:hypothetical protein